MRAAVAYVRSSKDRADVSLDSQRRAIAELAKAKSLPLIGEYADAVESGKDDQRPGYQRLLRDLASKARTWSVIIAFDTSRIARRTYIASALQNEARKRGVSILYVKVPETDPINAVILQNVFQAMDEVHSLMSREKGLAGMAENVRRGYRAGGRAPIGYRFERIETSTMRDGEPVAKSRLAPSEHAAAIAAYLRGRAAGRSGSVLARDLALPITRAGLVDVEWNALLYAGHTTWNVRRPKDVAGGATRRPRAEWMVNRGTHDALITDAEAETILARLEARRERVPRFRGCAYLLSGLVFTPAGAPWHGDRGRYATKGGWIDARVLERMVLEQLAVDLAKPAIVHAFAREVLALQEQLQDRSELEAARVAIANVDKRIRKLSGLVELAREPRPLLARLDELELERREAAERVLRAEDAQERVKCLQACSEADVATLLAGLAADVQALSGDALKEVLRAWIARIEVEPETRRGLIVYRLTLSRDKVASPRRLYPIPALSVAATGSPFRVPRLRARSSRAQAHGRPS